MDHHHQHRQLKCIKKRLSCLFGGIENVWYFLVIPKGVIFYYENVTPHASLATRKKLLRLGWEMMLYPPYSPNIAPSEYYLFPSLQNSLDGETFNDEVVKSLLVQFFADKDQKFFERGIMKLLERWQKVIE